MPVHIDFSDSSESSSYDEGDSSSLLSTDPESDLLSSSSEEEELLPKKHKSSNSDSKIKKSPKKEKKHSEEEKKKKEPTPKKKAPPSQPRKKKEPVAKETLFAKTAREEEEAEKSSTMNVTAEELLELTAQPIVKPVVVSPEPKTEEKKQARKKRPVALNSGKIDNYMTKTSSVKPNGSVAYPKESVLKIHEMDELSNLLRKGKEIDQRKLDLIQQKEKYETELEDTIQELKDIKKRKVENQDLIKNAYQSLGASILVSGDQKHEKPSLPPQSPTFDSPEEKVDAEE